MGLKIGDKEVGNSSVFIIAEAGVNHNGSLSKAFELVDSAVKTGADAIKFQTWNVNELYIPDTISGQNYVAASKKRCLDYDSFRKIKEYCGEKGIIFLSTPDEEKSADFLESLGVGAFKIGSAELNNHPFLEYIAKKNKPIILSIGMANFNEVEEAVNLIKRYNENLILLQCVSSYPTPIEEINLKVLQKLSKFNCIVGLSDHTEHYITPPLAVAMGAKVIEKHFTVDKNWEGIDNKMSLNPEEFKKMVDMIRLTEKAIGDGIKNIKDVELSTKNFAKKCIVAAEDLVQGTIIDKNMLKFKRPFLGLEPKELKNVIGTELIKDIKKDYPIKLEDLK